MRTIKFNMGYHKRTIEKGVYGHSSKILEEVFELIDAEEQNLRIMALVELSDIVGSIAGYIETHYPDIKMSDLFEMAEATQSAFKDGDRS